MSKRNELPGGPPRIWRIDPEGIQLVAGDLDMRHEHPAARAARARSTQQHIHS